MNMRMCITAVTIAATGIAIAQGSTSSASDNTQAVKMTKDELEVFLPGTSVRYLTRVGSTHRWTNDSSGKFVARTDNKKYDTSGVNSASGYGTWKVNDEGKYCVNIDWKRETEDWCAFILKTADGGYYLNKVDPTRKIEFSK